ncbi:MAG: hypothetical protein QW197_01820 [Candidatus Aenigmatarchaeota archaeon]
MENKIKESNQSLLDLVKSLNSSLFHSEFLEEDLKLIDEKINLIIKKTKVNDISTTEITNKILEIIKRYSDDVEALKNIIKIFANWIIYLTEHENYDSFYQKLNFILKVFSDVDIKKIIKEYSEINSEISQFLINSLENIIPFSDEKKLEYFIKIFSHRGIKEFIREFSPSHISFLNLFFNLLTKQILYIKEETTIDFLIETFSENRVKEMFRKYLEVGKNFESEIDWVSRVVDPMLWILVRYVRETKDKKVVNLLTETLSDYEIIEFIQKNYKKHPGIIFDIIHNISQIAKRTKSFELTKEVLKIINSYSEYSEILSEKLESLIYSIVFRKEDFDIIIKNLLDVFYDKGVGTYLLRNFTMEEITDIILNYSQIVKNEGIKGINKIVVSRYFGIIPTLPDFENKLKDLFKERYGIDPRNTTYAELINIIRSFKNLGKDKRRKDSFKKALELLFEDKYWED